MVKVLDWLLSDVPCTVATTHRGVGTVPEERVVVTSPLASDVADEEDNVNKLVGLGGTVVKSTRTPDLPLLLLSSTLNFTTELVGNNAALAVEVPNDGRRCQNKLYITGGRKSDSDCRAGGITGYRCRYQVCFGITVVILIYVEVAVAAIVVTGVVSVAMPALTQEEENITEIGTVAGKPFTNTGTLTLLVP
jgi:hypothetical protein